MMPRFRVSILAALLLVPLRGSGAPQAEADPTVENLRAFAKLYGYLRWFHPSDETAATDWDRLAIYGARRVSHAATPSELREVLEELFFPIAPTLRFYPEGDSPARADLVPADTVGLRVVAWQHRGVGLREGSRYRSIRLNRPDPMDPPEAQVYAELDAEGLRGRRIRLSVETRMAGAPGEGRLHLALVVNRETGQGFMDVMEDRPITSEEWARHEVAGPVAEDATGMILAVVLVGTGEARLRDFRLEVEEEGEWQEVERVDAAFRSLAAGGEDSAPGGWAVTRDEGEHLVEVVNGEAGNPVLVMRPGAGVGRTAPLRGAPAGG